MDDAVVLWLLRGADFQAAAAIHWRQEDEMKMALMAMILGTLMAGPEPKPVGTVLFVCEHGSAKSVVAAAHFNRIAADRGLPFRAISRGTAPDPEMAPAAV